MASALPRDTPPFSVGRSKTAILLIDDDAALLDVSAAYVTQELPGATTTTCTDPAAALDLLRADGYDCIVCDYEMPGMDGLAVLSSIRDAGLDVPFILFTGKGSEEIASQAISAGVDEYLQKGGAEKYEVLANKIGTLVEKYRAEVQVKQAFLAIESAEEGIGIIDENGIYQYMNEAYAAVYERERGDLIGQHWNVLYPAEEARRFYEDILPELEAVGSWRGVSTGVTKDGRPVPERLVLTQMENGGHVCIVQDLTDEDEMRTELALKDRALDTVSLGVVITDATCPDNPLVYVNEGFERLTGYDAADVLGEEYQFLQGAATDTETVREMKEAIDAGEPISRRVLSYRADGTSFWNLMEMFPVRDEEGTVTNVISVQREVPEP